jgi:hypothetical protein
MQPERRSGIAIEDLIEMEFRYSGIEPYRSLARYQHLICTHGREGSALQC